MEDFTTKAGLENLEFKNWALLDGWLWRFGFQSGGQKSSLFWVDDWVD